MENNGYVIHDYRDGTSLVAGEDGKIVQVPLTTPDIIVVPDSDGRILMRIDADGNYHGDLADASEAARVFCNDVQELMRQYAEANQAAFEIVGLKPEKG